MHGPSFVGKHLRHLAHNPGEFFIFRINSQQASICRQEMCSSLPMGLLGPHRTEKNNGGAGSSG